jgi:hypothetical protein
MMDPWEGQAKAIIAAALIVRGCSRSARAIPTGTERVPDAGGMCLRELTDYVCRLLTTDHSRLNPTEKGNGLQMSSEIVRDRIE